MSKVRINDLAKELEVKSRAILDILSELGVPAGKTHSSSLEGDEADKVRAHFRQESRPSSHAAGATTRHGAPTIVPKIDLSHISKPGDVLKAILAKKQEEEDEARHVRVPAKPAAPPAQPAKPVVHAAPAAPPAAAAAAARPEPRKIVPQPRQAAPIVAPPTTSPAIASRPPSGAVVAKPPAGAVAATRPVIVVAPPPVVAVKPPAAPAAREEKPAIAKPPAAPEAPTATPEYAAAAPTASEAPAPAAEVTASVPSIAAESTSTPVSAPGHRVQGRVQPAAPARRTVMPQTGPRPVYKSTYVAPAAPAAGASGGIQRGKPIFDRRPATTGPAGPGQRAPGGPGAPGSFAGGPRPKHPTRSSAGGFTPGGPAGAGARPGFGARPGPGGATPPPETQRPPRAASRGRGRGQQQYPKTKEGPMKGFVPPPRYSGMQYSNEPVPITREITVTEGISVKDLAEKLDVRAKDLIATLMMGNIFVTVNQSLDSEMIKDMSAKFGAAATVITYEEELANEAIEEVLDTEKTDIVEVPRAPVVTVMGHVDHGKTSLLDAIRETDVAAGEAGGITQHIGAYKVKFAKEGSPASGREIVFLDTPGHEAFTRMRARGAKVTDIVVVVVAADDGVMPQTLEAIDHAKAANVPIIVAVNKIDKPEANPDRVKKQLADRGLIPEEWAVGGEGTVFVEVSAKKRMNLDLLLEMICLVSDIRAPKATPGRKAVGSVIEAKLDRGRGAVATVLVQDGTLRLNESYIVGNTFGKVRAMFDDRGRALTEAGPSTPVEVLGLEAIPDAGDTFLAVADRDKAKGIAQYRKMKEREAQLAKSSRMSLEGLSEQIKESGIKDLPLIIKGDVTGSVEVLADSLIRMSTEKVRVKVLHSGVGSITESDVLLATASNTIIIGFNVRPERKAAELANQENVEIRLHSIIYELQDEIRLAMMGLLEPAFKENYAGRAEVLNIFKIPKVGTIAGCRVLDGVIRRDAEVRVMRDGTQIFKGKIGSLKRFKDDAREVTSGMECGIGIANLSDLKEGDLIEAFSTERLAADLGALTSAKA